MFLEQKAGVAMRDAGVKIFNRDAFPPETGDQHRGRIDSCPGQPERRCLAVLGPLLGSIEKSTSLGIVVLACVSHGHCACEIRRATCQARATATLASIRDCSEDFWGSRVGNRTVRSALRISHQRSMSTKTDDDVFDRHRTIIS